MLYYHIYYQTYMINMPSPMSPAHAPLLLYTYVRHIYICESHTPVYICESHSPVYICETHTHVYISLICVCKTNIKMKRMQASSSTTITHEARAHAAARDAAADTPVARVRSEHVHSSDVETGDFGTHMIGSESVFSQHDTHASKDTAWPHT